MTPEAHSPKGRTNNAYISLQKSQFTIVGEQLGIESLQLIKVD